MLKIRGKHFTSMSIVQCWKQILKGNETASLNLYPQIYSIKKSSAHTHLLAPGFTHEMPLIACLPVSVFNCCLHALMKNTLWKNKCICEMGEQI